jgi:hypothetical protein
LEAAVGFVGVGHFDEAFLKELFYGSVECPGNPFLTQIAGYLGFGMGVLCQIVQQAVEA